MSDTLEALLQEGRTFPPPGRLPQDRARHRRDGLRRRRARLAGLLGHAGARARLDAGVGDDPRLGSAVREVVRRRQAQRLVQLPRPPRRGRPRRPGRVLLGGRARRHARRHVPRPARRDVPRRQRAAVVRRREGRPRRDLHGHGARDRRRDARVRAHRRAALGRVRRLHRAVAARTASTTRRRRCSSPPTARGGAARSSR